MTTIQEKYNKEVIAEMKKKLGFKNNFEVPKITKVVVNVGVGKFLKDNNAMEEVNQTIVAITGQKPVVAKARQSIAGFKIREGLEVGIKVTLRGRRMWEFLERLVSAALPRVRDFHGVKETSVDSNGNLNLGIKEQLIFPEIAPEKVKNTFSFQVNVTTTAKSKEEGMALFRLLGFPIEKKEISNN
jgi:large subunit ribosomal protein L5